MGATSLVPSKEMTVDAAVVTGLSDLDGSTANVSPKQPSGEQRLDL